MYTIIPHSYIYIDIADIITIEQEMTPIHTYIHMYIIYIVEIETMPQLTISHVHA